MPPLAEPEDWCNRLRAGEQAACAELYDRFGKRLYRYALAITGDHHLAEDIVQDIYRGLFRALGKHDMIEAVENYLFRSARNACLNRRRAAATAATGLQNLPLVRPGHVTADKDWLETEKIHRCLAQLPLEQRDAVLLRVEGGHSFEAIAKLSDSNVNTIYKRYQLALAKLREMLQ